MATTLVISITFLFVGCSENAVTPASINLPNAQETQPALSEYHVDGLLIPTSADARLMTAESSNNYPQGNSQFQNPPNYDLQLAIEKGLTGGDRFGEKYLYMQALYRKVFENWLLENSTLRQFDNRLSSSDLSFLPAFENRQVFHQQFSSMDLQFIYVVNNTPIERLQEDDLDLLYAMIKTGQSEITPELTEMVVRTFSDVMMAFPDRPDNDYNGFRSGGAGPATTNRSIVLEIRNVNTGEDGNFRDSEENRRARSVYLENLAEEMAQVLSEQISHVVIVHVH